MSDLADWLVGWLAGLVGWLGWLAGWLGWLAWMVGWHGSPLLGRLFFADGCRSQAAGLIFFHMLLVLWWFGLRCLHFLLGRTGCRSHLFSHVLGCVVFWCEVFALKSYFLCISGYFPSIAAWLSGAVSWLGAGNNPLPKNYSA